MARSLDNTIRTLKNPRNREWVKEDGPLDERDIRLRNAAHYKAYSALRFVVFVGFILGISADLNHVLLKDKPLIVPLLWLFVLVVFNLPQSLILWFEPNMEEAQ